MEDVYPEQVWEISGGLVTTKDNIYLTIPQAKASFLKIWQLIKDSHSDSDSIFMFVYSESNDDEDWDAQYKLEDNEFSIMQYQPDFDEFDEKTKYYISFDDGSVDVFRSYNNPEIAKLVNHSGFCFACSEHKDRKYEFPYAPLITACETGKPFVVYKGKISAQSILNKNASMQHTIAGYSYEEGNFVDLKEQESYSYVLDTFVKTPYAVWREAILNICKGESHSLTTKLITGNLIVYEHPAQVLMRDWKFVAISQMSMYTETITNLPINSCGILPMIFYDGLIVLIEGVNSLPYNSLTGSELITVERLINAKGEKVDKKEETYTETYLQSVPNAFNCIFNNFTSKKRQREELSTTRKKAREVLLLV